MSYQNIFKRYEIKYLITQEQKKDIIEAMEPYMQFDEYGRTTIRNVYLDTQIEREISYFIEYYGNLSPKVFLSYEREAFFSLDGSDFRVTFDDNILWRQDNISLKEKVGGNSIIGNDEILMELKTSKGIPLWMTDILSKNKLYKTSFSKYGRAYMDILNRKNMKIAI